MEETNLKTIISHKPIQRGRSVYVEIHFADGSKTKFTRAGIKARIRKYISREHYEHANTLEKIHNEVFKD